ncbi:MAG: hypothetical protein GXP47_15510 [Acidobacteria bacterium]|nr:hypothetical protein [Acidobacteriota bacterium]
MGTYSGDPSGSYYGYQSERDQARDLFKRFLFSFSRGIQKVFPAFGLIEGFKHDDGYFDHTGLIYDGLGPDDPGLGVKKLGYFTYKKMTELLEGADWNTLESLATGNDALIALRVQKDGRPLVVAWWDAFGDAGQGEPPLLHLDGLRTGLLRVTAVVPSVSSGADVNGYEDAFAVRTVLVVDGRASISVGGDPLVIEEVDGPPRRRSRGRVIPSGR